MNNDTPLIPHLFLIIEECVPETEDDQLNSETKKP